MTTREDRRFTAAVAAMQGFLANTNLVVYKSSNEVVINDQIFKASIVCADALIKAADENAPPTSVVFGCRHETKIRHTDGFKYETKCCDCGEVLP